MSRAGGRYAIQQQAGGAAGVDLDLLSITATPSAPTAGEYVVFTITIKNNGATAVPAGRAAGENIGIGIYISGSVVTWTNHDLGLAPGATLVTDTVSGWAPGGAWYAAEGTHTVTAFVDDLNLFAEGNEVNNTKAMTLTVAPGAGGGTAWRLHSNTSLWNTPKSQAGPFATQADGVLSSQTYGLNNGLYGHPFFISSPTDPMWTVHGGEGWAKPDRTVQFRAPEGIYAAGGGDSVMTILAVDGTLWDFYGVHGGINYGTHFVNTPYLVDSPWNGAGFGTYSPFVSYGTAVAGCAQASGTILASDVAAGVIPHGLFMAFDYADEGPGSSGTLTVYPAIANDIGGATGPIPQGGLLLATGSEPGGLNAMEHQLWLAASTYGVYVCDRLGGIPMFYGDTSAAVGNAFTGGGLTAIGRRLRLVRNW